MQVKRKEEKITMSYRIPPRTRERLEKLAEKYDVTVGVALEAAIDDVWDREMNEGQDNEGGEA